VPEDQLFFVGQKAFIDRDGSLLVLFFDHGKLDFPGGRIQAGETDWVKALRREVREETGLEIEVGAPFVTWRSTKHPQAPSYLVGYRCKYVSGEVTLSEEHDSFLWVDEASYHAANEGSHEFALVQQYFAAPI
jgi:8-oxo-dGTP diphosphatase